MRVRFADAFLDELDLLEQRLAQEVSPDFAVRYVQALIDRAESLADFAERFAVRPDLGRDMRALVFRGRYVVGYRIVGGEVRVLRLLGPGQETSP